MADTEFKFDYNVALQLSYIRLIGEWLQYAKEKRVCTNPTNSRNNLDRIVKDFFIKPKFEFYKAQSLYTTFNGVLKQPFLDWKIVDEEWFTRLDTYYKKLLINTKLKQLEGDFTND